MKKSIVLLLMLLSMNSFAQKAKHISIFADHIEVMAKQKNITLKEAAQQMKELGYGGADVYVTIDEKKLKALDEAGLEHSCCIATIDFTKGDMAQEAKQAIDFMKAKHYDRVLLVPGLLPKDDANALALTQERIRRFTECAEKEGLTVTVEDYDNPQSPCYNTEAIDKIIDASPLTGVTFDTGNFVYCQEDVMSTLEHFYGKIKHVHLKDRKSMTDMGTTPIGKGCVPTKEFIIRMLATGYNGYFTAEFFGAKDMYSWAKESAEFISAAYDEFYAKYPDQGGMGPQQTEIWTPQPRKVDPSVGGVPSDAIVLFNGVDLKEWQKDNGEPAGWKVENGIMTVDKSKGDIVTRRKFGSYQLHLEWRIPSDIQGESQARGNSGVFMQDKYEVQILDSYDNPTYIHGQAGSIYKQSAPLVNAMNKPGEWNVYDIIYTAPVFKADGSYLYRPFVTVIHNGVVIQNHTEIFGTTEWIGMPRTVEHGDGPIRLQSHGDPSAPISFRNIWIRPL